MLEIIECGAEACRIQQNFDIYSLNDLGIS